MKITAHSSKIRNRLFKSFFLIVLIRLVVSNPVSAQELYPLKLSEKQWHNREQQLRYHPEGEDFVIVNGTRRFTRALYGTHTAFRVEAGDLPEIALYMPGMGGNLKFGIVSGDRSTWLNNAKKITARYRPGSMIYEIEDALLGTGKLKLELLAMADAEGFVVRSTTSGLTKPIELVWFFGGASGKKFSRDGDMGPDPESSFYLKPENCKDNIYTLTQNSFQLSYGAGQVVGPDGRYFVEDLKQPAQTSKGQLLNGVFSAGSVLRLVDASAPTTTPLELFNSAASGTPMVAGKVILANSKPEYLSIHNPAGKPAFAYSKVPEAFIAAEAARKAVAGRITIKTPDPYINTVGAALAIASDAVWESPSYMHGSIGWRMRLNGWRGAYTADALGWHDRARTHLRAYAQSQVLSPATGPILADTAMHLSRSTEKLGIGMFTEGYISRDPLGKSLRAHHYDMNLVYIDAMLRHFQWTGDLEFVREMWPVLKRHLAWEKRNFDVDGDGLYDAYAAIWASDALQYSGGGVAHSSAYNYLGNKRAAEIATMLGEDPAPYRAESQKILKAMNSILWIREKGTYAEFKDLLGNQLLHDQPAIWTIYHSLDLEVPDPFQAYQSVRYIDTDIPHIPIRAKGLPDDGYYTISTSKWMPYTWSLNNVALAESMHAILANWQAGRNDEAYKLFKSEILQSMYIGGSPGNIVQISQYDAVRAEAYRDFADPIAMVSRAVVEGLFGIVPDALNNALTIRPGIPSSWNFASFSTPDFSFDFKKTGLVDTYTLIPKFQKQLKLKFQAIARAEFVQSITINGKAVSWKNLDQAIGKPLIEINAPSSSKYVIKIVWKGKKPLLPELKSTYYSGESVDLNLPGADVVDFFDPVNAFSDVHFGKSSFIGNIKRNDGEQTSFIKLKQGDLTWWMPLCFRVTQYIEIIPSGDKEDNVNTFRIQYNKPQSGLSLTFAVNSFKSTITIPAGKLSDEIKIPEEHLFTGTNRVELVYSGKDYSLKNSIGQLTNWDVKNSAKLEMVDLDPFFNDKVSSIFRNKYLTPRPQVTTLQLPWQGTGDWPHPLEIHEIDDSGLRRLAGAKDSFSLPQGITFSTPGTPGKNNIGFTSQWDNYPKQLSVPLSGKSSHAWLLMAGSTNPMQSQFDNGEVVVTYTDGTSETLKLRNPETWWPIEKDYYTDDFAFALKSPRPIRVHLKTGSIVQGTESKTRYNGREIPGGAATVLDLPLDNTKTLKDLTLRTIANDVVIGLMAVTLAR